MLSTFDLTLLGSLVCAGGLAFLLGGKRLRSARHENSGSHMAGLASQSGAERSTSLAGTRWLAVGVLTLLAALAHGADEGYLFSPWGDVFFHLLFVSSCWFVTAVRLKRTVAQLSCEAGDDMAPAPLADSRQ